MANKYKTYKFTNTYACGHEGTISRGGYTKEYAENRAEEAFADLCPECKEIKYKEMAEIAQKEAEINDYAELEGSEKQIQWALSIRQNLKDYFDDAVNDDELLKNLRQININDSIKDQTLLAVLDDREKVTQYLSDMLDDILKNQKASKFYIDNRRYFKNKTSVLSYLCLPAPFKISLEPQEIHFLLGQM
jgi:hypothetical protein